MHLLLTYDLDKGHSDVKKYLLGKGYDESVTVTSGESMKLPNTTLIGDKQNSCVVSTDFKAACSAYNRGCVYEKDKIKNVSHFIIKIDFEEGYIEHA